MNATLNRPGRVWSSTERKTHWRSAGHEASGCCYREARGIQSFYVPQEKSTNSCKCSYNLLTSIMLSIAAHAKMCWSITWVMLWMFWSIIDEETMCIKWLMVSYYVGINNSNWKIQWFWTSKLCVPSIICY